MQQRLSPIFRAKPNIAYTMILMGWNQFFANKADQSMDVYWPGKQYIDVLGFDPYNWYDTTEQQWGQELRVDRAAGVLHQDQGLVGCHWQQ